MTSFDFLRFISSKILPINTTNITAHSKLFKIYIKYPEKPESILGRPGTLITMNRSGWTRIIPALVINFSLIVKGSGESNLAITMLKASRLKNILSPRCAIVTITINQFRSLGRMMLKKKSSSLELHSPIVRHVNPKPNRRTHHIGCRGE